MRKAREITACGACIPSAGLNLWWCAMLPAWMSALRGLRVLAGAGIFGVGPRHDRRLDSDRRGTAGVVELKADEDIHLPLQGLDYWSRVAWHHQRGEFQHFEYFPEQELSAESPLLFLVAPALHVHPATETLLRYISPEIEWTVVGIDERWRDGVQQFFANGQGRMHCQLRQEKTRAVEELRCSPGRGEFPVVVDLDSRSSWWVDLNLRSSPRCMYLHHCSRVSHNFHPCLLVSNPTLFQKNPNRAKFIFPATRQAGAHINQLCQVIGVVIGHQQGLAKDADLLPRECGRTNRSWDY